MVKLFRMEDPVKGVFSLEFIGPCHINADIGLISAESGPDFSSTLAEGDGRTPIFSHQEMGPAKRAADHLNRERRSVGRLQCFQRGLSMRRKVMIPQGGDEAVPGFFSVRPLSLGVSLSRGRDA